MKSLACCVASIDHLLGTSAVWIFMIAVN